MDHQFGYYGKTDPNGKGKCYLTKGQGLVGWVGFETLIKDNQTGNKPQNGGSQMYKGDKVKRNFHWNIALTKSQQKGLTYNGSL